jgi:DNA helicase HerA-like ATPase
MVHLYISGTTGGGKSFLARVLVEEAARHKSLNVLVLDPRNQSIGILVPEDRPKILEQYEQFRMKSENARGFKFIYFAPGLSYASPLPPDLSTLAAGRSIVSFKGLDDEKRCALAGNILDAAFEACNAQESESPRLLIVVDEAQLFTRRRLDESAKQTAAKVERALDRIAREGRKFGIVLALVSQTMKDFAYELASIRQMTTAKIFLRNSDREIEYADDIIGDGRLLVQLPTGTALVHNANWGVVRIRVRPPYSKVFELGDAEIRRLVGKDKDAAKTLTTAAQSLFAIINEHGSSPGQPLNMSRASELAGINSKRRFLDLIGELEQAGVIRTKKLIERGRPRVIELVMESHNLPNAM